jgi:hypothetical protein
LSLPAHWPDEPEQLNAFINYQDRSPVSETKDYTHWTNRTGTLLGNKNIKKIVQVYSLLRVTPFAD